MSAVWADSLLAVVRYTAVTIFQLNVYKTYMFLILYCNTFPIELKYLDVPNKLVFSSVQGGGECFQSIKGVISFTVYL